MARDGWDLRHGTAATAADTPNPNDVDDVKFTRALLDDLPKVVTADSKRVYATGISNGGILCYRLASELSDRVAAIAPVSGTMGMASCHPQRPVSVMHFHGTDDRFVPFNGGKGYPQPGGQRLLLRGTLDPGMGPGRRLPSRSQR